MSYATIDALRESLARPAPKVQTPEYIAKMMHEIPKGTVVDRMAFVLQQCAGKRVLELGASGAMHDGIVKAAASVFAIDRQDSEGVLGFDLDDISQPTIPGPLDEPDLIVCGEILEHLGNPGWCVTRLHRRYPGVPLLVTVPNAFTTVGVHHLEHGVENVNKDHVAWYSYRTLRTLLERAGYTVTDLHWYNGEPYTAEGLIVLAT